MVELNIPTEVIVVIIVFNKGVQKKVSTFSIVAVCALLNQLTVGNIHVLYGWNGYVQLLINSRINYAYSSSSTSPEQSQCKQF